MRLAAYLIMMLLFSTATAQNPTILKGDYISNVFGQSNFVKNPNAQTGVAYRTLTNANAQRSTATPLVATTEWNVTITSANGTVAWETRTFDEGMKNQNCEARFTYRGFQATSKAQIKHGTNVVAELVLTPSATDPRIASINFPCGDLSSATTFVITDTAILSGTHEIGGIYVGLATNQANIAQAEVVVRAMMSANQGIPYNIMTPLIFDGELVDKYNAYDPVNGQFTFPSAGCYKLEAVTRTASATLTAGNRHFSVVYLNGLLSSRVGGDDQNVNASITQRVTLQAIGTYCGAAGESMQAAYYTDRTSGQIIDALADVTRLTIYRFPSSSELVVTPETQNVWGSAYWTASGDWTGTSTTEIPINYSTWGAPTLLGSALTPSSSCGLTSGDIGFCIDTLPPGTYEVSTNFQAGTTPSTGGDFCYYNITVGGSSLADTVVSDTIVRANVAGSNAPFNNLGSGVLKVDSLQKNVKVILKYRKLASTTQCIVRSDASPTGYKTRPTITIKPIDNNANSALYVQGPVKAAGTGTAIQEPYQGFLGGDLRTNVDGFTYSQRASYAPTTSTSYQGAVGITLNPGLYWCSFNSSVRANSATGWYSKVTIDGQNAAGLNWSTHDLVSTLTATYFTNKQMSLPIYLTAQKTVRWSHRMQTANATEGYHEMWCMKVN